MDPARMFEGELDRKPGIREQPGSRAAVTMPAGHTDGLPLTADAPLQRGELAKSANCCNRRVVFRLSIEGDAALSPADN